jgi:hypothetical protein
MTKALLVVLVAAAWVGQASAGDRIYRCGNEYTNTIPEGNPKGCKPLEGGNVTVVQAVRPGAQLKVAANAGSKVDSADQRARDADAKLILEAELKKALARQQELLAEYNNGEPEKRGDEHRNNQKYLDRVADLKAAMARNDSDIAGIQREMARAGGGAPAAK